MSPARACRTEGTCASFLPAPNHTQSAKKGKRQLRILQKRHGRAVAPREFQLGDDAAVEWHPARNSLRLHRMRPGLRRHCAHVYGLAPGGSIAPK